MTGSAPEPAAMAEEGLPALHASPVVLDGRTLTAADVLAVACDGEHVELASEAAARNAAASQAVAAIVARGEPLYGVTTGVGVLRTETLQREERRHSQLRLLRSHAGGGGALLHPELVRAAMVVRANQLGAGGAGVSPELLDALVAALNAGVVPAVRELGSLGTGDLTVLAEIALALLGEGAARRGTGTVPAAEALAEAGLTPAALGPRDGIGFMSSNAGAIGQAAVVAGRAARVLDRGLAVAALSFSAAEADPVVLDARVHAARPHSGQVEVAGRMRVLLGDRGPRRPHEGRPVHDPFCFRCLPQVEGPTRTALQRLEEVVAVELNAAAENALIVAGDAVALPNGNFHAGVLALALDGLSAALAQSSSLAAARVSALMDETVTGLAPMLAENPGADSGAMVLEYTAHAGAAAARTLAAPASAQYVSVSAGVEAHGSFASLAAAQAAAAVERTADTVAVELVAATRALLLGGRTPAGGAQARALLQRATEVLSLELGDRPFADDIAAARRLVVGRWARGGGAS